jgi:Tfp pilus assembly protein PilF
MTAYRFRLIAVALLAGTVFLVYIQSLGFNFVYDDAHQVLTNYWIRDIRNVPVILGSPVWSFVEGVSTSRFYRPMMHLLFMVEYHVFGLDPMGWHLVNVGIHCLNTVMVFVLASRLIGGLEGSPFIRDLPALLAGAVFALHPVNAEAVSWVSSITELTYTFFFLLSFCLYMSSVARGRIKYTLSVALFFIALLCKESAMALIVIIPVYQYFVVGSLWGRFWRRYVPFLVVAAVYMVVRTVIVGGILEEKQLELTVYEGLINASPIFMRYIFKLLLPINLSVLYTFTPYSSILDPLVVLSAAGTLLIAALVFVFRRRRVVIVGISLITIPLLPVLYAPLISRGGFADRYMYLPSVGFALIVSYVGIGIYSRLSTARYRTFFVGAVSIVLILYAVGTVYRSATWRDGVSLWGDAIRKSPRSFVARYNLAMAYESEGKSDKAVNQYKEAIIIEPDNAKAYYNLALLYQSRGNNVKAVPYYLEAIRVKPSHSDAHYNLAVAYDAMGNFSKTVEYYREAIRFNSEKPDAHFNLGLVYSKRGVPDLAIKEFLYVLKIDPAYKDTNLRLRKLMEGK